MITIPKQTIPLFIIMLVASVIANGQKRMETIEPTSKFDIGEAYLKLDYGTNTIRGTAYLKKNGINFPDYKEKILLYPVTPYLLEFIELKKKNTKRKRAVMSRGCFITRIEAVFNNQKGEFEFANIRPGKYYLITWINYQKTASYTVQTGTRTAYNMAGAALWSSPITEERHYSYDVESEVSGFVEVSGTGQVITTTVNTRVK